MSDKKMLTIKEVAKIMGLSEYEIRRRVHIKKCPHIRVGEKGSKILIDLELFIDFLHEENIKNMQVLSKELLMSDNNVNISVGHENLKVIN